MIRGRDPFELAQIALARLGERLVFAILFAPFNLFVASATNVDIGRGENPRGELGIGIVLEGERILVRRFATGFLGWHSGRKCTQTTPVKPLGKGALGCRSRLGDLMPLVCGPLIVFFFKGLRRLLADNGQSVENT